MNELKHHGVKGMRWGHRKKMYKQIQGERSNIIDKERGRLDREYGIKDKQNKMYAYAKKHGLTPDGIGDNDAAMKKYDKMYNEIDGLSRKSLNEATKIADKKIIEKYGNKTVSEVKKYESQIHSAQGFVIGSVLFGLPVMAIGAGVDAAIRSKKK